MSISKVNSPSHGFLDVSSAIQLSNTSKQWKRVIEKEMPELQKIRTIRNNSCSLLALTYQSTQSEEDTLESLGFSAQYEVLSEGSNTTLNDSGQKIIRELRDRKTGETWYEIEDDLLGGAFTVQNSSEPAAPPEEKDWDNFFFNSFENPPTRSDDLAITPHELNLASLTVSSAISTSSSSYTSSYPATLSTFDSMTSSSTSTESATSISFPVINYSSSSNSGEITSITKQKSTFAFDLSFGPMLDTLQRFCPGVPIRQICKDYRDNFFRLNIHITCLPYKLLGKIVGFLDRNSRINLSQTCAGAKKFVSVYTSPRESCIAALAVFILLDNQKRNPTSTENWKILGRFMEKSFRVSSNEVATRAFEICKKIIRTVQKDTDFRYGFGDLGFHLTNQPEALGLIFDRELGPKQLKNFESFEARYMLTIFLRGIGRDNIEEESRNLIKQWT